MLPHISMTYRDWQEKLISAKGSINCVLIPKNKITRPETGVYAKRIKAEIKRSLKGIKDLEKEEEDVKTFGKTIIVPVAIPGCGMFSLSFFRRKFIVESDVRFLIGKTLVPIATKHLFVFGPLRTTM